MGCLTAYYITGIIGFGLHHSFFFLYITRHHYCTSLHITSFTFIYSHYCTTIKKEPTRKHFPLTPHAKLLFSIEKSIVIKCILRTDFFSLDNDEDGPNTRDDLYHPNTNRSWKRTRTSMIVWSSPKDKHWDYATEQYPCEIVEGTYLYPPYGCWLSTYIHKS